MDEKTAKIFRERSKVAFEKIKEWLVDLLSNYKFNSEEAKIVQKYAIFSTSRIFQIQHYTASL